MKLYEVNKGSDRAAFSIESCDKIKEFPNDN